MVCVVLVTIAKGGIVQEPQRIEDEVVQNECTKAPFCLRFHFAQIGKTGEYRMKLERR